MSYPAPSTPDGGRHARGKRGMAAVYAGSAVAVIAVAAVVATLTGAFGAPRVSAAAEALASTAPPSASASVSAGPAAPAGSSPSAVASSRTAPARKAATATAAATSAPASVAVKAGWIDVDPAAWQKQLSAFRALEADPVPSGVGDKPEFRADCTYGHRLADDPIVLPGLAGASHMHSFVGNKAVDADTTAADLTEFTATTCKPVQDHSAYWVPTLYDNATGKPVETTGFRVYYRSLRSNSATMMPVPNGLRIVAGDAKKKVPTPRGAQGQFYCAFYGPGDLDGVARSTDGNWPICGTGATFHFMLQFPDCWDGEHLDSPDHKAHMAFGDEQGCPADHPVRIPAITFDIQYGVTGTAAGYHLSSDPAGKSASSMHGDAFVMWDAAAMNKRTRDCVAQRRTCGNDGYLK